MDLQQLPTNEVGVFAKKLVAAKLEEMGISAEIPRGKKNIVIAGPVTGNRRLSIRVKSRRSGTWQISITEGISPDDKVDDREFWVLVDFAVQGNAPDYYIMSGSWLRRKIYADHKQYLLSHGGVRPVTPKSTHHSVFLDDVKRWKERWDILDLDELLSVQ